MKIKTEYTEEVQDLRVLVSKMQMSVPGSFRLRFNTGEEVELSAAEWNFLLDCALRGYEQVLETHPPLQNL